MPTCLIIKMFLINDCSENYPKILKFDFRFLEEQLDAQKLVCHLLFKRYNHVLCNNYYYCYVW